MVIVIVLVMAALTIPAIRGLTEADSFNGSLSQIAGILEQARAYATGQNTYVWVAFYPVTSTAVNASGGDQLFVAVFASSDGTNPLSNSLGVTAASYVVPSNVLGTNVSQVFKVSRFKQIRLAMATTSNGYTYFSQSQIASLPSLSTTPSAPAQQPQLLYVLNAHGITLGNQTPPSTLAPPVSIVQFSPQGSAQVAQNLADEIEIDFEPMSGSVVDTKNLAALRINGLTGLTTIYRN